MCEKVEDFVDEFRDPLGLLATCPEDEVEEFAASALELFYERK